MLINVLRDEHPDPCGRRLRRVAGQTFRPEEYPEYKANRNKSPSSSAASCSLIHEVLDALRIITVERDGFEADDIIGTLATQALADDFDVLILSGDRDSFQLVTDHCTMLYPMRGVSELARMTPDGRRGALRRADPARYPELAAMVGESSDNLPGVPGVGPGFAASGSTTSTASTA